MSDFPLALLIGEPVTDLQLHGQDRARPRPPLDRRPEIIKPHTSPSCNPLKY